MLVAMLALGPSSSRAEDATPDAKEAPPPSAVDRQTPLAGEAYKGELFGEPFELAPRDRAHVFALLAGAGLHSPRIAAHRTDPFLAFYTRHLWDTSFLRASLSGFQNDVEFAQRLDGFELVARANTYTPAGPKTEAIDDEEAKLDRVEFGRVLGEVGFGYRKKTGPAVDNEVRADVFYEAAWVYVRRSRDTASFVQLPPDTLEHGLHLRIRFDGLERNLLELPHSGVSAGADLELLRRDRWDDTVFTTFAYREKDSRDFLRAQAYVVAATGLPFLSERHRFVLSLHGGYSPPKDLDRFSVFRLGSGPVASESYDLARRPIPGLLFDQVRARDYLVSCIEYRFEALFFLFLHVRYTTAFANHLSAREDGSTRFVRQAGHSIATAVSSGFFLQSSLYLEYAFSTAQLRGRDGHSVLFVVAKAF